MNKIISSMDRREHRITACILREKNISVRNVECYSFPNPVDGEVSTGKR